MKINPTVQLASDQIKTAFNELQECSAQAVRRYHHSWAAQLRQAGFTNLQLYPDDRAGLEIVYQYAAADRSNLRITAGYNKNEVMITPNRYGDRFVTTLRRSDGAYVACFRSTNLAKLVASLDRKIAECEHIGKE